MSLSFTNQKTGKTFRMERDRSEINEVVSEFTTLFNLKIKEITNPHAQIEFTSGLYDLFHLHQDLLTNYYQIDRAWLDINLKFEAFDFQSFLATSPTVVTETNKLVRVSPMLFNDKSAFYIFIDAVMHSLRQELYELKKTTSKITDDLSSVSKSPSANAVTLLALFGGNNDLLDKQIKILQSTNPPMLNSNKKCKVADRQKSAWSAWIHVMNYRGLFDKSEVKNNEMWRTILNQSFNVIISKATLSNDYSAAYKNYKSQLLKLTE